MTRYVPSDAECRCLVCGDKLAVPELWIGTTAPDRRCPEGAQVVTDCRQAMAHARAQAWIVKTIAAQQEPPR